MTNGEYEIHDELDVLSPVPIVSFLHSNSPLPPDVISDPNSSRMQFSITPPTDSSDTIFTATTSNMTYEATPLTNQITSYYIAVRDKNSGNIRLLPTQIFQLSPKIKSRQLTSSPTEEKEERTYRQKQAELVRAFGSSKDKRKLASAERSANDPELLADTIGQALSSVKQSENGVIEDNTSESLLLPIHHPDTDQPADIYLLEELIPETVLNSVSSYAREIRTADIQLLKEWRKEGKYQSYVLSWFNEERLNQLKEHSRYHYKPLLRGLVCLHFLLAFYLIPIRKKYSSSQLIEDVDFFPVELRDFCLASFADKSAGISEGKAYSLSKKLKDKLLLFIITISVILEDYKMDPSILISNLQIQPDSARKYFLSVGCKFVSNFPKKRKIEEGDSSDVSLKLFLPAPLQLPKRSFFRKKF
ncbi:DNA-directed RNA polymerase I subunit RPA49 [Oopsacas minuta]|uniref:DNA-directed RNA polymerase I subunit RPA49 n=1 Tax=Oopsacas minuta TaxID=111878 RepID=A0AAV7JBR9_9METZ|nr:DNA-directed RNA polymerase I subunit RPA49 [Oopsacas minuta]